MSVGTTSRLWRRLGYQGVGRPVWMCYACYVRSIGIRELRQHASQYLRQAQQGETIEIPDRGQQEALLTRCQPRRERARM